MKKMLILTLALSVMCQRGRFRAGHVKRQRMSKTAPAAPLKNSRGLSKLTVTRSLLFPTRTASHGM